MDTTPSTAGSASGLLAARDAAIALLDAAAVLPPGWALRGLRRLADASVVVDVGPADGPGLLLEWHDLSDGRQVRAFAVGERYAVGYRSGPTAWSLDDAATPMDVREAAARLFQLLAHTDADIPLTEAGPGSGASAAAPPGEPRPFDAETVQGLLSGTLKPGDELAEGWRLEELHPFGPEELAVVFVHPGQEGAVRVKLRPRDDARPAACRTATLDVLYRAPFGRPSDGARAAVHAVLARELALHLEAVDDGVGFVVVRGGHGRVAAQGPPPAMNLALTSPCHQRCAFCSVHEEIDPMAGGEEAYVAALRADIERAAAMGTKVLRVNGLEPLNAPYIFDLLALARDVGFESFHLLSTCLPMADRAFAERVMAAMPATWRIYAPIYGAGPLVHDAVVGRAGAFDELMVAIGHIRDLATPGGELLFTTILMRQNADDMAALAELVRPLCRWWEVHLPFPNTSSARDRYRGVALPMSRALDALYPAGGPALADLPLGEVLPCIALAHQRRTGHALLSAARMRGRQREPSGTFYETIGFTHSLGSGQPVAFTSATVRCPHAASCALAKGCPQKVYAAYAEEFGLDELQPATRADVASLPQGPEMLAALDAE